MTDRDDFDSPWKDILGIYFFEFMEFFFPQIAGEIDWTKGYESLEKELRQITREAEIGFRLADKLFKLWKKNGEETWALAHVEVQAQEEKTFGHRMFVYHYRIHDLRQRPVVSLAILADNHPQWQVSAYEHELWGCSTVFKFPTVKLLSYKQHWADLEASANPFAMVVMAHLQAMETQQDRQSRLRYKLALSKALYRQGWLKDQILNLYRFIDWIMALPEELEQLYHQELLKFEEEINMQYVTTAERIGTEKGLEKGLEKGRKEGRIETARNLIALGVLTLEQIAQVSGLSLREVTQLKQALSSVTSGKSQ